MFFIFEVMKLTNVGDWKHYKILISNSREEMVDLNPIAKKLKIVQDN